MTDREPPVIDPSSFEEDREPPRKAVVGVVLAAGTSERYGDENKLLATIEGEPMIRRSVRPFVESRIDTVAVVLGCDADAVREVLEGMDIHFLENPGYPDGQGTSVRVGTKFAQCQEADGIVFGLGDMPEVSVGTVDLLCGAFDREIGSIIPAAYEGVRGNPVLFAARHFQQLSELGGDSGGRGIIRASDDAACVETGDPGVMRDIDRPDDRL